jgi:CRP-like cAMP-binding protein
MVKNTSDRRSGEGSIASPPRHPSLAAIPFRRLASTGPIELFSDTQRQQLLRQAVVRDFRARTIVYRADSPAEYVFIIGDGVVKSYRDLPSGRRRIAAFLFARDLFGLAESGRYVNTVQTITPVRAYALHIDALTELFAHDPDIEFSFLCKMVHVLREAQHHNIIVGRRDAMGRLAMLLRLLRKQDPARNLREIAVPMSKSDIANYLGLSLEAVVRATRRLELQGIMEFVGRHQVRILDHSRFEALATAA